MLQLKGGNNPSSIANRFIINRHRVTVFMNNHLRNRLVKISALCAAFLYPSVAMADYFSGLDKLAKAFATTIISLSVLIIISILFVHIPYSLIKQGTNPRSNFSWLHYLLCAPIITYLCFVISSICIVWAEDALSTKIDGISGVILFILLLISIIIYPCTHKLMTYCLNRNTQKTIRTLQILSNIICILCCLAILSLIPISSYTLQDASTLLTIDVIVIIPFALAWFIHNKLFKKMKMISSLERSYDTTNTKK